MRKPDWITRVKCIFEKYVFLQKIQSALAKLNEQEERRREGGRDGEGRERERKRDRQTDRQTDRQ